MKLKVPVLSILLIGLGVHGGGAVAGNFVLKVEQMEALEGVPVVVRVTLHYQGKDPREVRMGNPLSSGISVEVAEDWEPLLRVYGHAGPIYIVREFQPGASLSQVLFLHHDYKIPKGKVKVGFTWSVQRPDGKETEWLDSPSTSMEMDVPPASAERLVTIRRRMEAELDQEGVSEEVVRKIANEIWGTRHKAFIPVAFRLLQSRNSSICYSVTCFIYECSNSPEEAQAELVNYLCSADPKSYAGIFDEWGRSKARRASLSTAEVKRLMNVDNIWIRALTYTVAAEKCDPDTIARLLAQLAGEEEPVRAARVGRLIADLDSDRFVVREEATAELIRLGELAEPVLRKCLLGKPSPEVRRRIELILEELADTAPNHERFWTMKLLESWVTPETRRVLEALAQGMPDTWRAKEAKAALERMAKQAPANR